MTVWVSMAFAQATSEPAELIFHDDYDLFSAVAIDTGNLPSGSPLAVRFQVLPTGGMYTDILADSTLNWGDRFEHVLSAVPQGGIYGIDAGIDITFDVHIDVAVWSGDLSIWERGFRVNEAVIFDTLALPGSPDEAMTLVVDSFPTFQPFQTTIGIIPTVNLDLTVDLQPAFTSLFGGLRVDSELDGVLAALDEEGAITLFDVPPEAAPFVEMQSTYVADVYNLFELLIIPSAELDTPLGDITLASFEIPIDLFDSASERLMAGGDYVHPLPAMQPIRVEDAGEVFVGERINLSVPLSNFGEIPLEGTVRIEGGSGFSVYPNYFAATEGRSSGVVVTFEPRDVGLASAALVIESNDPSQPYVRVPLVGTGIREVTPVPTTVPGTDTPGSVNGEDVKSCGCSGSGGSWAFAPLLGALFAYRRRSRNFTRR